MICWQGIFFDIPFELHIAGPLSSQQKKAIGDLLTDTFTMVDSHLNHWNPDSEISRINTSTNMTHPLSPHLRKLIETAQLAYTMTDGYYDPAIRERIMHVKSALKSGNLPSEPKQAVNNFGSIQLKEMLCFTQKTSLDFDGMLKGYIIDRIRDELKAAGHINFLINWSGDIYASGNHPDGRKWKIFVPRLQQAFELQNMALATSGSETQHWLIDGKTYTHIINPKTGIPLEIKKTHLSHTVVGPSCALADAFATASLCAETDIQEIGCYKVYK